MNSKIAFTDKAWEEYCYWQTQDKKTLKRINLLLIDIMRNSFEGIGKPEPLKNELAGLSRRTIDDTNTQLYRDTKSQNEEKHFKAHNSE